jgi:lipoprotein-anchoring transpeptidase ErfK/SrfK
MPRSLVAARRLTAIGIAVTSLALVLAACSGGTASTAHGSLAPVTTASSTTSTAAPTTTAPTTTAPAAVPVHVRLLESDGSTFGVGMPIVAYFDKAITDPSAFLKATTVTVNGAPAGGGWYFEPSGAPGEQIEAHYRQQNFWPADAQIRMNMPIDGLSAGAGFVYNDSLTLAIATGASHVSYVNGSTEQMTVYANGVKVRTMPVSLGKATTPTFTGTKIAMEKDNPEHMVGTPADPYNLEVPWSVRMTNSGEFVHAASWNGGNIGVRSTSNGCTNLNTGDAEWFYNFTEIGDPVLYTGTGAPVMPTGDGYGDWNVPWPAWQLGGLLPTSG